MKVTPYDILFEYLRDIIYEDDGGKINISALPKELQDLGKGLELFAVWVKEAKDYSRALSDGHLNVEAPPNENILAAPLKSLQATMNHISWQAQQVAKGDYTQHIDFMGELSEAFNEMTDQLKDKTERLERSRDNALRSGELFKSITDELDRYVFIIENETRIPLYYSSLSQKLNNENEDIFDMLIDKICEHQHKSDEDEKIWEIEFTQKNKKLHDNISMYYSIDSRYLMWNEKHATIHIVQDISEVRRSELEMEKLAYVDALTGLHNRHYIMPLIDKWMKEERNFCLTFIDLDNLKHANDDYGHDEGDRYIKGAVEVLTGFMEEAEVARVGGDEFLVLVPDIKEEELIIVLEKQRKKLRRIGRERKAGYTQTFSYGIVEISKDYKERRAVALRRADSKMYKYKMTHKPKIKKKNSEID